MAQTTSIDHKDDVEIEPLFYPSNKLSSDAPLRWLKLGFQDMKNALAPSLVYGFGMVIFFDLLTWVAWSGDYVVVLFTFVVAFILAGPILAFGLYSISRQLEQGLPPRLGVCYRESKNQLRNELLFALVILVVLLVWARAASMTHVFFPISDDIGVMGWIQFLAVGSAVGSIFATVVFCFSVVALPMMLDRNTDAITSALTSINAVLNNKAVMLVWGLMIAGLILLGFVTALLGLAFILPLVGHASWHAYRETVVAAETA